MNTTGTLGKPIGIKRLSRRNRITYFVNKSIVVIRVSLGGPIA